jgi:hypothetical protein
MVLESCIRFFVDADTLDRTSAFYRSLLAGEETLRFAYPDAHLQLAAVSSPPERGGPASVRGDPTNHQSRCLGACTGDGR